MTPMCNCATRANQQDEANAPADSLGTVSKGIHQQRKRRRWLATARIIKMIAGKRWTPVGKNADKSALGDVPPNMSFREVRKAKTFERSFQEEARAIEHKLPLDTNVELSPVLFELPRVEAATVSRQAKIEAVVVRQVLRCLGPLARGEVGG
jgi:hypothetical protein